MADLPNPQSYEQLLGDMLSAYAAKLGINDFNVGSVNTSFFEVVALMVARSSGDVFQILKDFSVDRATGDTLKRLAVENNVTPIAARPATGLVNVIDSSFTKISTKIYSGANPPNIGSTAINISDASQFPASGSIYIGRGTPNVEGPLPYATPPVQTGGYWVITVTSPTAKFHNLGESVILAQGGNRSIGANTIVLSPGVGSTADIQYSVTTAAVVLDGETEVDAVQVSALTPGSSGNVPIGAVKTFATPPFPGATVTNVLPFTTGADNETDDQLRVRIKNALASTGLGTATAVKASLIGATPSDEQATIVSDSLQTNTDGSATVFVDDGTGYEAKSTGVGLESVVDSAIGGEQFFQLQTGGRQAPVAKAFLQTTFAAPFDLVGGDTLAVVVGGTTYQHTFKNSDFRSPGGATAFEVTASINSDVTLGFEATTAGGGVYVVIRAKAETHDSIQTTVPTIMSGRDAAIQMGFPSNLIETLRLYKNNVPLSKDGSTASVFSQAQQLWSATIANGDTLILSVDDTAAITYTITNADFIATGLYTSVAATNSLESWVEVFNAKLTGVTATIVGQQLEITSNLGAENRAEVSIDPSSTLVSKGMFVSSLGLSSNGAASDFTLDRNTAQFELTVPLVAGDTLSAGTLQTEGMLSGAVLPSTTITFSSDAHIWILIDDQGTIIPTGVTSNTNLTVSTPSTNVVRYTSNVTGAFLNVLPGDYVIIWSAELPSADRIEGRVHAVTATTLDILITPTEYAALVLTTVTFVNGFVVMRSIDAPQKFRIQAGAKTLDQITQELQSQTQNLVFSVFEEKYFVVATTTMDTSGSVLVVTADTQGEMLNFPVNSIDDSKDSLIAFYNSGDYQAELPLFIHALFGAGTAANPIDSYIQSFTSSISLAGRDPNELIAFLHPYGAVADAQPYGENIQESSITGGTTIGIAYPNPAANSGFGASLNVSKDIRRIRSVDRFYIANPLDFGFQDTIVAILNNDPSAETFTIPLYRRSITNTTYATNPFNFNAYDVDSGATASFTAAFGAFDFSNFKALMRAKKVLKPTPPQTAILYRSVPWGRSGEKITVAYVYPSTPNTGISSSVSIGQTVDIEISLASGVAATTSITSTTQWNITVTANTPSAGIDQVTYTWNGVGTNPALTLSGGEYVNITKNTAFNPANQGIFRVSTQAGFTPTATAFSVQRPTGVAVPQSNVATAVNGAITFYQASPTTAAQVQAYVTVNLPQYISATLVNDGGMSGSGVIVFSTYENSGFTTQNVRLLDGINWIFASDLTSSPQFIFKVALSLPTDVGYAFNNGEEVRLIPTTIDQVSRLIGVLAVSGFSTDGTINVSDRSERLELATSILGSTGAIQVVGGLGNEYETPILDAGERLDNTYMTASVDRVASQGVSSDQWFRLQASQIQSKIAGFSSNSSITTLNNTPISNETTITMAGRTLTQRYFGKPRNHVRTQGSTFRVEKQGSLVCVSWNGVGTPPAFIKNPLNFNDTGGGTVSVSLVANTSDAQYTILTGNANFTELSIGDLITISGRSDPGNNGTFLVTGVSNNGKIVQVTNTNAVTNASQAFVAGQFTASSGVSEGDTVFFSAPFSLLNQGRYRVIREFSNSIWIENPDVIEEEVTLPYNPVSLAFDATTSFSVSAANNSLYLSWNGTGTEPLLGNAQMGDVVTLGTDFAAANQGSFMVLNAGTKLQQIAQLTVPAGSQFTLGGAGTYFEIYNAGNANQYYVWFNVNGSNSDPGPVVGFTGIVVAILSGDTATTVAAKLATAINGSAIGLTATSLGAITTVTTTGFNQTNNPVNINVPAPFIVQVTQVGRRTFLEAINPSATTQASVLVTGSILQDHRPQIQFSEYEATVAGDLFTITGSVIGTSNAGSYTVIQTLSRDSIIISANLANVTNVSMSGNETSIFPEEGVLYSGYKHVFLISAQPETTTRNELLFDTNAQYQKINEAAGVQMTSLGKLNFPTALREGLDSYRYNTGLIAEANRIIYGDPRDPITYPGVGAAGADIFVREPLAYRIQVAVDVRLLTGAPFNNVAQQVRSSVSSLINANPVGQSIDISSIVSVVRAVPGVQSVAISSPQYDSTHDLITLVPSQKAIIIDPTTDISVDQIGN